jgi:hypothetical protein
MRTGDLNAAAHWVAKTPAMVIALELLELGTPITRDGREMVFQALALAYQSGSIDGWNEGREELARDIRAKVTGG